MKTKTITAYKGFESDLSCRGFVYKIGETYTCDGEIKPCANGFHACSHPLSVWSFYDFSGGHRFAVVEQSGEIVAQGNKTASRTITIKAEVGIPDLTKAAVEWTKEAAEKPTSGNRANTATSGAYAPTATSGKCAHSATSGNFAHSATSGDYANSATSGNCSHSATGGNCANSATSGDYAHSATSGDYSHSATSGGYAHSSTSGDYANSSASGDYANSSASGYHANSEIKGNNAVAVSAGGGMARAGTGGAIVIVERDDEQNILAVFASKVGENGIEPDIWYRLKDGTPVAVRLQ